jgi:hypothetical protein
MIDCVMLGYFLSRGKRAELGVYDKRAEDATTLHELIELYQQQPGRGLE